MRFSFLFTDLNNGELLGTRVLNKRESGVAAVGITLFGRLCYRERDSLFSATDITKVAFKRSIARRGYTLDRATEAEFDIRLSDGRKVQVWSVDRAVIKAAMKIASTDAREYARGR